MRSPQRHSRPVRAGVATLAAAAFLLGGCGGADEDTTDTGSDSGSGSSVDSDAPDDGEGAEDGASDGESD